MGDTNKKVIPKINALKSTFSHHTKGISGITPLKAAHYLTAYYFIPIK